MRHVNDPAPKPSRARPGIPPQVDAVVLRALEKDPTRRWPSTGAFAAALRDWREIKTPAVGPAPLRSAATPPRGSLAPTLVVVILVLGALVALLWAGFRGFPSGEADVVPTAIIPSAPAITGGLSEDDTLLDGSEPSIAPNTNEAIAPAPTEPAAAEAVPTIAPIASTMVQVPNLQGQSIAASTGALLPLGLRIALGQPTFSDSIPLNAVVSQDPPPGAPVLPDTIVRVSLSRGPSPFGAARP